MAQPEVRQHAPSRDVRVATIDDPTLGPLRHLPGEWVNDENPDGPFFGRGWNLIALPFEDTASPPFFGDYRVLVSQYNEVLRFTQIDGPVPNRGIDRALNANTDQDIFALDYEQSIKQIQAADFPESGVSGKVPADQPPSPNLPIHHEPGFFLFITNQTSLHQDGELMIARQGAIPHGNSVLSMGRVREIDGPPRVPPMSGLPVGVTSDLANPYLAPYEAFSGTNAFRGVVPPEVTQFPGFDVVDPAALIRDFLPDKVTKTTELRFDTKYASGNIVNIPFVERQADASEMESTFYIMERDASDGGPDIVLAYVQLVFLDFFPRPDGVPGLIRWPHVSINMMIRKQSPDGYAEQPPMRKMKGAP